MDIEIIKETTDNFVFINKRNSKKLGRINSFFMPKKRMRIPSFYDNLDAENWVHSFIISRVKAYFFFLLSKRNYHSQEIMKILKEKRVEEIYVCEIMKAIDPYLDDDEYINRFIKKYFEKGYGPKYIFFKLKQKEISINISEVISKECERECLLTFLSKKKKKIYEKDFRNSYHFFFKRGFSSEIILEVLQNN